MLKLYFFLSSSVPPSPLPSLPPCPRPFFTLVLKVALLKAAAGLSDEELTWRMETAKPEANAYRIASAALERAETTYERLLWRQVRERWAGGRGQEAKEARIS